MGIEHINRLGWIIIGAIVGIVFMTIQSWNHVDPPGTELVGASSFETAVFQLEPVSQSPLIKQIVIQPPTYSEASSSNVQVVTFKRLFRSTKDQKLWWVDQKFIASIPYSPANRGRVTPTPDMTVQTYLNKLTEQYPHIKYSTGWWLSPVNSVWVGALGGMLLIGGIWPTMLGLMSGAGFGRKYNPKYKDDVPLWRMKSRPSSTTARPTVSAADMAKVSNVANAYESNLAQFATAGHASTASGPTTEPEVRKLDARPLEEAKPLPNPDADDEIEVKGEFYPVMIHHKKHQQPADDPQHPNSDGK